MIEHGPRYNDRAEVLRHIAVTQARAGNVGQAEKTFAKALQAAKARTDEYLPYTNAQALGDIATARAETGNVDKALDLAKSIELTSVRAELLGVIALAQAEVGNAEQADKTLAAALNTAKAIKKPATRCSALGAIAGLLAKARDIDKALDTAKSIELADWRVRALVGIAAAILERDAYGIVAARNPSIQPFGEEDQLLSSLKYGSNPSAKTRSVMNCPSLR